MAEPTTAMTFSDLVIAVAVALQIQHIDPATGVYAVPVDKQDLAMCKHIVNNGIRMFVADAPSKGWRWMKRIHSLTMAVTYTGTATAGTGTSLTDSGLASTYDDDFFVGYSIYIKSGTGAGESATITDYTGLTGIFEFAALSGASTPDDTSVYTIAKSALAIDGDGARYLLPEDFGGTVDGKITYAADSNHGTQINWVDEARIRDFRSTSIQSGYPVWAATLPYSPTSLTITPNRRWEIFFEPRPASIQTVRFPYTMHFNELSVLTDVHPAGFRFDEVIQAACRAYAQMEASAMMPDANWMELYMKKSLPQAQRLDLRSAPRRLGPMINGLRTYRYREFDSVTTDNDE